MFLTRFRGDGTSPGARTPGGRFPALGVCLFWVGCASLLPKPDENTRYYHQLASRVSYDDVPGGPVPAGAVDTRDPYSTPAPFTADADRLPESRDLTLEEAVRIALSNASVLRELGGTILTNPQTAITHYSPGLVESDPRFGVQAALSEFDARFRTNGRFENNDRAFNNSIFGGGTNLFKQDLGVFQTELSKQAATGSQFAVRNNTEYDANNANLNLFPSAWTTNFELEFRQPLLQGAGVNYNRIAGPNGIPGLYNGVVLARVNTDIEMSDFELGVLNLLSNVENAYWDLYFAYRELQAKIEARNGALTVVNLVEGQLNRPGFDRERLAEAQEQYWRFEREVDVALCGRGLDGTRSGSGTIGGTFRAVPGVFEAERRLRTLLGLPISDGQLLLRPVDEPISAEIVPDWSQSIAEAMARRQELRRQRQVIRRHELQLAATENRLKPTLDVVGLYRWRGFGHDLIKASGEHPEFDNAFEDLTGGRFQEWQIGVEMSLPIGFRHANNALLHYKWQVAHSRAVLREQEQQVVLGLSTAWSTIRLSYRGMQQTYNQWRAAKEQVQALSAKLELGTVTVDELLDAQRRLAESEIAHFLARVEYTLAIKNFMLEKGALLDYNTVTLVDGWPQFMNSEDPESRSELNSPAAPQGAGTSERP